MMNLTLSSCSFAGFMEPRGFSSAGGETGFTPDCPYKNTDKVAATIALKSGYHSFLLNIARLPEFRKWLSRYLRRCVYYLQAFSAGTHHREGTEVHREDK